MVEGILGRKLGMTQLFSRDGTVIPVTVVEAGPCVVVQRKSVENDGYEAVQIGLVERTSQNKITKPMRGHFEKHEVAPMRRLTEFAISPDDEAKAGDPISVDDFKGDFRQEEIDAEEENQKRVVLTENEERGDRVDVTGVSKGKGFQGVMKRHNFGGGGATHGSMFHRAPGSIGQASQPSKVLKGTRMAGRLGGKKVTVANLQIALVDADNNLLYLRGAVPGGKGSLLRIGKTRR